MLWSLLPIYINSYAIHPAFGMGLINELNVENGHREFSIELFTRCDFGRPASGVPLTNIPNLVAAEREPLMIPPAKSWK
jgi:hypothetical protein